MSTVHDYVRKIREFYRRHKRMPNYREIMELLGFRSTNAVAKLVARLEKANILEKDDSGKLIPKKLWGQVRVLGIVEAGFPSPAEEETADTMSLDEFLIRNPESTFMLEVKGDSMQDAGILAGDMVLAERGPEPRHGDIVIAEVDNGWTMKYFQRRAGKIWLMPANKRYKPIIPRTELKIEAIVRAVIRKYRS
jgi:SOS regulatory protein LexA